MEKEADATTSADQGKPAASGVYSGNSCCQINRNLLPIKAFYFTMFASIVCLLPYIVVFGKHQGLEAAESGVVGGVMPFLACLAQPLVGLLADRWAKHTAVIVTACLLSASFCVAITFVPPRRDHPGDVIAADVVVTCSPRARLGFTLCSFDVGRQFNSLEGIPFSREGVDGLISLDKVNLTVSNGTYFVSRENKDPLKMPEYENRSLSNKNCNATNDFHVDGLLCKRDIIHVLSVMTSSGDEKKSALSCRVLCSDEKHRKRNSARTCLVRNATTISSQDRDVCNLTESQTTFPQKMMLNSVSHIQSPIISNNSNRACPETDKCNYAYEISSLSINSTRFHTVICEPARHLNCKLRCEVPPALSCGRVRSFHDVTFWGIFLLYLVSFLALSPLQSMGDAVCYGVLGKRWQRYGQQRVWGTIGWLVASGGVSLGVYVTGGLDYAALFYFYGACMGVAGLIACTMSIPDNVRCGSMMTNMGRVLVRPKVLSLLVVAFTYSVMSGACYFSFWFLEDLGASSLIFGLCNLANTLPEVPIFFLAGTLIRRFGPVFCVCVGVLATSLRVLGYALLDNPWLVLLVEPLNGVTVGVMFPAATTYVTWVSPPGMEATSQGLLGGVMYSLGRGVGMLLTGWMFEVLGARTTFAVIGGCGLVITVLYGVLNCLVLGQAGPPGARDTQVKVTVASETLLKVKETREQNGSATTTDVELQFIVEPTHAVTQQGS